jgi:hypothetical protein
VNLATHLTLSSAEIKNESRYTYAFPTYLHGVVTGNFTS